MKVQNSLYSQKIKSVKRHVFNATKNKLPQNSYVIHSLEQENVFFCYIFFQHISVLYRCHKYRPFYTNFPTHTHVKQNILPWLFGCQKVACKLKNTFHSLNWIPFIFLAELQPLNYPCRLLIIQKAMQLLYAKNKNFCFISPRQLKQDFARKILRK